RLTFDDIAANSSGLLAGVLLNPAADFPLPSPPGFAGGEGTGVRGDGIPREISPSAPGTLPPLTLTRVPRKAGGRGDWISAYREVFGDRCYAVAELHHGPDDQRRLARMLRLAGSTPVVAANDVHYHIPERRPLQEVLTALRHKCAVADLGEHRFPNAERHLKD